MLNGGSSSHLVWMLGVESNRPSQITRDGLRAKGWVETLRAQPKLVQAQSLRCMTETVIRDGTVRW
jgi:hypothetical protein